MNQEIQNKKKEYAADIFSIKEARLRIQPFIHQTPVLSSESINAASGKQLFFKCECFQKGGAFKFRGACNAIYSLDDDLAAKGVVTHSSGNHAAALSLAAKLRGIPAYVVIPETAPKCKVENVVRYGGQVIWSEATVQSRESVAKKVMQETGAVLIHPYNDGRIISGQGTISLELLEQVPQLDTLIVPISGGGLISGISVAAKSINPAIRIFGAEPKGANDAAMSKATGKIVTLAETNTIADGLRAFLGDLTWPIIRDLVDDIITVEDKEIIEAMRLCYEILKVVVEPSGAIGLAAVLSDSFKQHPCWKDCERVGIILSGVIKFARATGDLQTLSDVDLKLIALTYTLEAQIHGTQHLRDCPPPIHTVNVKRLPEKDLPGWGSNVPNMEEWEALEQNDDDPSNSNSKILPLQDLNLNIIPSDTQSENGSLEHKNENDLGHHDETESGSRKSRRFPSEKKEINIEGKMVADGIDASQGQYDDNAGDWMPAVSRSTQRRYYRRKARREYNESLAEKDGQQEVDRSTNGDIQEETTRPDQSQDQISELSNIGNGIADSPIAEGMSNNKNLSDILKQMRLEEDSSNVLHVEGLDTPAMEESDKSKVDDVTSDHNFSLAVEGVGSVGGMEKDELEQLDNSSITNESVDTSFVDDATSEQSWMLRSLSESSVACVTGDFAMQNVLLQMGLRLLAPGGMQIRELHRWILKCHACYTVTAEIGRIFCPKCGNGGTLRKVAVTVGENGVVLAARKPRITLRGTKFSLPLPQSGRDAITKNLVLREDQLPQKFLHPKTKKKVKKEGDDEFFTSDDFFNHHTDRRGPLQPPVRQALAVFSGKRNPNDNHYSRSKHR